MHEYGLKVLHAPYGYFPDAVGGTEVYVATLTRALASRGISSTIAAPGAECSYNWEGVPVRRFGTDPQLTLTDQYGSGDRVAARNFTLILDDERPDVVHLHALTPGVSLLSVRAARDRRIPVVLTYHTPTVTCPRGNLLHLGSEVCDGRLIASRCAACMLQRQGVPSPAYQFLGGLPGGLSRSALRVVPGPLSTAVGMRALTELRHESIRAVLGEVDRVVVLAGWTRDLLLRNGVPSDKLVYSPHGTDIQGTGVRPRARSDAIRIAYMGRLAPEKGVDTLIRAMRSLPHARLSLDLYGISEGEPGRAYRQRLQLLANSDPRIHFREPIPHAEISSALADYDVLAVPSRWLETGPLVILEAFAAGIPVIGTRLGGIAELVGDGVNGILVDGLETVDWTRSLNRLLDDPSLLPRLTSNVVSPRTPDDMATDMIGVYQAVTRSAPILPVARLDP